MATTRNMAPSSLRRWLPMMIASCLAAAASLLSPEIRAAAPADDSNLALEEIVVTAEKREERAQSVPISMEVFNGQALTNDNTTDFKDLQSYVPNLTVQSSPGNDAIYIRGFGSSPTNYAFEQSVSMYLDGIYGGRNKQFMSPFFDIDRIEVLRGPQGALLGKNTAAGAISIVTGSPTRDFQAATVVSYDFERKGEDLSGFVSGPLTEGLSGRLAVKYTDMGGWIDNIATGTEDPSIHDKFLRGSLKYDFNSNTNVVAKFEYGDHKSFGNSDTPLPLDTSALPSFKDAGVPFGERDNDRTLSRDGSITANIGLGDFTLQSITGYSQFHDRSHVPVSNMNPEVFAFTSIEDFNQFSEEVRLLSPTNQAIEYILGAYADTGKYFNSWYEQYNLFGGSAAGANQFVFDQHSTTKSVFAQGKWHIADQWSLQGSLRYTDNAKHATFNNTALTPFVLYPDNAAQGAISSNEVDPSLTLQYALNPNFMAYATYARGSKGGGFVSNTPGVPQADFAYQPEKSTNYEVGLKTTWLDNRILADIAVYDTMFKDLQVSVYDIDTLSFQTKNAARATSRGVESTVQWLIVEGLRFSTSFAYLDGKFTDFPGAQCTSVQPPTCNPLTNNAKGEALPNASRWSGDVVLEYSHSIPGGLKFSIAPAVLFRSAYIIDSGDPNPIYGIQDGWVKYDGRISLGTPSNSWQVSVIGKNLSNKRTSSVSYVFPFPAPAAEQYQDETRSIALQLAAKF